MNHQDIISQKIEFLNGNRTNDLSPETLIMVKQDPELASEIEFVEQLWKQTELDRVSKPSAQMQARFYQMLSHAQSVEATSHKATESAKKTSKEPLLVRLGLFQPAFQVLLLVVVFGLGWSLNSNKLSRQTDRSAVLENKVEALNVMVALSMLGKDSTAERLAGVDYAKNVSLDDERLVDSLLALLNGDRSSAVRLSVVDVLAQGKQHDQMQRKIVDSLSKQSNPIVQVALVELLQNYSKLSQQQLQTIFSNEQLDEEVARLIKQNFATQSKTI